MNITTDAQPSSSALGDNYVREFPKFLSKEEIRDFSQISGARFLGALLIEILTIAATVWVSETYWNPFVYLLAVIIIGSRLHAFAVLMHEAAHYRASPNRDVNDFLGEAVAFPLTITMRGYRNKHFAHHRELNSENDPDWVRKLGAKEFTFPKSRAAIYRQLAEFASGAKTYAMIKMTHGQKGVKDISPRLKMVRNVVFLVLIASSIILGCWKQLLLYWVVPLLTSFGFFEHIRSVAEHFGVEYEHTLNHTRSVVTSPWESWLFAPYGIHYHLEHHLYPSVPFYRLPELHQKLMAREEYAKAAHITQGYVNGLLRECSF